MGKIAGSQPKAKAKAEPASALAAKAAVAKADAKPKGKDAPAKEEPKVESKEEQAKVKFAEEATQKLQDDERDERNRKELREQNRKIKATGPQMSGSRVKTIDRVTRFQNKLKLFKGEIEFSAVEKDIDGVDASKYVCELADCIVEAAGVSMKLKELMAGCKVCTRLRATYEEFSPSLSKALKKAFEATPSTDLNRRRFLLRFCIELCLIECIPAERSPLLDFMKELADISAVEETLITNFTIISSVAQKHAIPCFSIIPSKQKAYEEALGKAWCERACLLEAPLQGQLSQVVVNAYQSSAAGLLQTAHSRLLEQEKINAKLRVDKGAVDADNQTKHEELKGNYSKLQATLIILSDYLNQPMPVPVEEDPNASRIVGRQETKDDEVEVSLPEIWEDEQQQIFYEEVMDPKDVMPEILLQSGKKEGEKAEKPEGGEEAAKPEEKKEEPIVKDKEELAKEKAEAAEAREERHAQMASDFDLYLARVAKAESAKQVDEVVVEFFHEFNSKANRRTLAASLFGVQRTKLHLLAPHARYIATIAPYMKDVPNYVLTGLQQELEQMMKEKNPVLIEAKIRTVRYLCELCKFKVCPAGVILDMYKEFCDDFSHHHAELCAHILQCIGRFLLYTPETAMRTDNLLERMARLKNAKAVPLRLEIMLEDSYYQVKPPVSKGKKAKDREPLELFVQHLVTQRLYQDEDEDKILKFVRKLPWQTSTTPYWLKKYILDLNYHANYENLYLVASFLSGLCKYRDTFVIEVIDTLFEHIQCTIERNDFREMPLRVRQVKLLGELYNYRLVDSQLIFDALYQFIGFSGTTAFRCGHATTAHRILERALAARKGSLGAIAEEGAEGGGDSQQLPQIFADPQHTVEAPWDFFRIKLVCVLLETCAHYYDRGAVKQKLDRFLQFFCRYVHSKGELPLRFMNMVYDTLERLRPKLVFPPTKEVADAAVMKLLQAERETLDLSDKAEVQEDEAEPAEPGKGEDSSDGDDSESSDDDEDSEEEDSEEESSDEESSGDEEGAEYSRGGGIAGGKTQHEQELDDFDKEVQAMLISSLEREKNVPRGLLKELPDTKAAKLQQTEAPPPGAFSLIQKKSGGKMMVKQLDVPSDSKLGQVVRSAAKEGEDEKADLKRFIMQYDPVSASSGPANMAGGSFIRMRAGKGSGKVGGGFGRPRAQKDYVKSEFMPEDEPELPAPGTVIRMSGGKGGPGRGSGGASRPVGGQATGYGGGKGGPGGPAMGYSGGGKGGGPGGPTMGCGGKGGPGGGGGGYPGLSVGGKGSSQGGKAMGPRRSSGADSQGTPSAPNARGTF